MNTRNLDGNQNLDGVQRESRTFYRKFKANPVEIRRESKGEIDPEAIDG